MLADLLTYKVTVQLGLLFLAAGLAARWGAAPERLCAGTLLWLEFSDRLYHAIFGTRFGSLPIDPGHFLIDLTTAASFFLIATRANRFYPLCLAALQLAAVFSHLARLVSADIARTIYGVMIALPSYFQIPILLAGILLHARRARRTGSYPSWLGSSPRSPTIGRIGSRTRFSKASGASATSSPPRRPG